jgi:hypothetical protein
MLVTRYGASGELVQPTNPRRQGQVKEILAKDHAERKQILEDLKKALAALKAGG